MHKKQLTVWEAACIITGYGVGGGIMAIPYLTARTGIVSALLLLIVAFAGSWIMHTMIAEVSQKSGVGSQVTSIFSRYLFRGKAKVPLTIVFFALMAVVLVTNLTAYIVGAAEIITGLLPVSDALARVMFYIVAASVVLLGLKAVGVSEKVAVAVIFALVGVLACASITVEKQPLPALRGEWTDDLRFFSMALLSFSAFFSIPQAVEGLNGDSKKIKKAIFLGIGNNFILIVVITLCALLASKEVTEVAMTGWSAAIGSWAQIIGGLFTILAMLTTYWSISLALSDIVKEQFHWNTRLCWVIATLPSFILTFITSGGYIDFLELAGGAIAIIIALMFIPIYRRARLESEASLLGALGSTGFQIAICLIYLLMAIGSVI